MKNLVAAQIKQIQLHTKRLLHANLLGHSRSLQKGSGMEFDQLRDYQMGDDVRAIDWNSSARMNKLLIKQFNDERYRTIIIALDISSSAHYGSSERKKSEVFAQVAAIISYAAFLGKDEVGLILFHEEIELYIPPRKGNNHLQSLLEKIFSVQKKSAQTSIKKVLDYIAQLRKKNAMVFLISDFIDNDFEKPLGMIARLCDLIVIRMLDVQEKDFPAIGLITMRDSETNQLAVIDTRKTRKAISPVLEARIVQQNKLFMKNKIDVVDIVEPALVIDNLVNFFKVRKR